MDMCLRSRSVPTAQEENAVAVTANSATRIQGVPGGKDLTSGECSLGQTIPI